MDKKIKFTIIIISVIITSIILVKLLDKNSESVNVNTIQKASNYNSTVFFEYTFTDEQICYGKNNDGSTIPLECDIPVHGNSPLNDMNQSLEKNNDK